MTMFKRIAVVVLLTAPLAAWTAVPVPQAAHIDIDGQTREYLLVTPDDMPAGPRALVLVLHGHTGTAANALGSGRSPSPLSVWLDVAAREKILVAALQGVKGPDDRTGWNDCRADADNNPDTDDVAFAQSVVKRLVDAGRVDAHRIYVMGMSNGAFMSLRLALQMQPAPAAIAAAAGTMAEVSECQDTPRAVSVLLIHGTGDPLVPYGGGQVGLGNRADRGGAQSVAATRDYWLRANGLQKAKPVAFRFPHQGRLLDKTSASKQTWGQDSGPQVEVVTIDKGGHIEPSKKYDYPVLYRLIVGAQNHDLEAVEEAWAFFHNKRAP
jgi:polyhydroxybutyrate depolymerase